MPGDILDTQGRGQAGWRWPSIHPEAHKFAAIAAVLSAIAAFSAYETLAWPLGALVVGILAFFRDPQRVTPLGDRLVMSTADGLVTQIQKVTPTSALTME